MPISCYSPNDTIFGHTYQHWIERYWNTYRYPNFLRRGPVYCLPGIIPEVEKRQRLTRFKVNQDKAILVSPMNFLHFTKNEDNETNKLYQKYLAKQRMDVIGNLFITLDNQDVSKELVRVATDLFELDYKYTAASDGFWLFLKPNTLPGGRHVINSFGSCSSGQTQVTTNYTLDVVGNTEHAVAAEMLFDANK